MATYTASGLTVKAVDSAGNPKSQFATDEDVLVKIVCDFQRKSPGGVDPITIWAGDIYLNSISSANLLDSIEFARLITTAIDTGHYERTWRFGKRPAGTFSGTIVVAAHDTIW